MAGLIARERATYEQMWTVPAYAEGSPALTYLPLFLDMAQPVKGLLRKPTVLDAGCGSGRGAVALADAGFAVTMTDLTRDGLVDEAQSLPFIETCLWGNLKTSIGTRDWVVCCDVMEHIPPTFVMLVVQRLLDVAKQGVFLSISYVPDSFGAWAGLPLHQTVQPHAIWMEQLSALATVVEARDLLHAGCFLLKSSC